jgi:hypothetical protein
MLDRGIEALGYRRQVPMDKCRLSPDSIGPLCQVDKVELPLR